VGQAVVLTDRSAFDGAPLVAWHWAFGDGQVGHGTPVTHAYSEAGSYTVTLSITDACGFASSVQVRNALLVLAPGETFYLPIVLRNW
jgi:PKD repeat protein